MAIAKGKSNIKSERDLVILGIGEQISILNNDQTHIEKSINTQLVNIQSDSTIDNEEKTSIKRPLLEELQDIQEKHIRIRRTILIGMYTFWELSLQAILGLKNAKFNDSKKKNDTTKNKQKSIAWNYLNAIYEGNIPAAALDIDDKVRVLRNHMVHGKLAEGQLAQLKDFSKCHPELYLTVSIDGCNFLNYNGLFNLLDIISSELNNAEVQICNVEEG